MPRRAICAAALAAVAATAFAPVAHADSIVFVKDSNVWLANPDGSGQYQVTTDGTASAPYSTPSQADDGTIVAIRNFRLHRMRQNGEQLNRPAGLQGIGGISEIAISPNGQIVAYSRPCTNDAGTVTQCVRYVGANGEGVPSPSPGQFRKPSWIDNTRTLISTGNTVWTDELAAQAKNWFDASAGAAEDGEVAGTKLAMVDSPNARIVLSRRLDSGFETDPEPVCYVTDPTDGPNGAHFADPTWSPGGGILAWQEGSGIWSATSTDDSACPVLNGSGPVIPGGAEPDFGPAAVNPGPRPGAGGTGGGSNTQAPTQTPTPPQTQPQAGTDTRQGDGSAAPALVVAAPRLLGSTFPASRGFRFRLELSQPGRVSVRVERIGAARRSRALGTVTLRGRAGVNTFTVRKVRGRRLRPGRYRARVAVSGAGASAPAVTLRFRLR